MGPAAGGGAAALRPGLPLVAHPAPPGGYRRCSVQLWAALLLAQFASAGPLPALLRAPRAFGVFGYSAAVGPSPDRHPGHFHGQKSDREPWRGSSIGYSDLLMHQGRGLHPWSERIQGATRDWFNKWNNKSLSLKSINKTNLRNKKVRGVEEGQSAQTCPCSPRPVQPGVPFAQRTRLPSCFLQQTGFAPMAGPLRPQGWGRLSLSVRRAACDGNAGLASSCV